MVKTNFTKVEDILDEGLRKMTVNRLLKLADVAAGMGQPAQKSDNQRKTWISAIKRDLVWLFKEDKKVYKKLDIDKEKLENQLKDPEKTPDEEWKEIYTKVKDFKEKFHKMHPKESDKDLIESERLKHINKRFNVSEKWLPLH